MKKESKKDMAEDMASAKNQMKMKSLPAKKKPKKKKK